ncbi:transaldolase, partial [Rhizobium ruizarguesonis]
MTSKLDQRREITTVVANTGDIEAVARLKPVDCTTTPSIVLQSLGPPMFAAAIKEAVAWGRQ